MALEREKIPLGGRLGVKRVNRRFTNPAATAPRSEPSSFDEVVRELNLSPEEYQSSQRLRDWVLRNKDQKYVPSELLKAFGFQVISDL
jgi:hypothetical protein